MMFNPESYKDDNSVISNSEIVDVSKLETDDDRDLIEIALLEDEGDELVIIMEEEDSEQDLDELTEITVPERISSFEEPTTADLYEDATTLPNDEKSKDAGNDEIGSEENPPILDYPSFQDGESEIPNSEIVDVSKLETNDDRDLIGIALLEDEGDELVIFAEEVDSEKDRDDSELTKPDETSEFAYLAIDELSKGAKTVTNNDSSEDIEVDEVAQPVEKPIWKLSPVASGKEFENREGANIAGNFPVLDDFRDGNATSFKAHNLLYSYQGETGADNLERVLCRNIDKLAEYRGRDEEAKETTWGGVTVRDHDIHSLTLKIGVPSERSREQQNAIENAKRYAQTKVTALGVPLIFEVKDLG